MTKGLVFLLFITTLIYPQTDNQKLHLYRIKEGGIQWVRLEDKDKEAIEFACKIGLNVIVVLRTQTAFKKENSPMQHLFWLSSDWTNVWENYVKEQTKRLKLLGVKVWQVENELNHPIHHLRAAISHNIRKEIVRIGANAIRDIDPDAIIIVNLYAHISTIVSDISIYKSLRDEGAPINILGMDYYRGSWYTKGPSLYPKDLINAYDLWDGDIIIMETGFSTYPDIIQKRREQIYYIREVFQYLDNFFSNIDWFKGVIWCEYKSNHAIFPIEDYFGLHYKGGLDSDKKPGWDEFTRQVQKFNKFSKFLGIMYR